MKWTQNTTELPRRFMEKEFIPGARRRDILLAPTAHTVMAALVSVRGGHLAVVQDSLSVRDIGN